MLHSHSSNVNCCVFVPQLDAIVSNSEDRSIRAWDNSRRKLLPGFPIRRDHDRFWVLAVHPTANLIAAGHDNGLVLYKLGRERALGAMFKNQLYYIKVRELSRFVCMFVRLTHAMCRSVLCVYDASNDRDVMVDLLRRRSIRSLRSAPPSDWYSP